MTTNGKSDRSRDDLLFFGRIAAGISHEMNNIISIVHEVGGLLNDLAAMAERGKPLSIEKIRSLSENIERQVARGKSLTNHLNRFAHSVDERTASFDMYSLVENIAGLSRRFAERHNIEIVVVQPEKPIRIANDSFRARAALFQCIDALLDAASEPGALTISIDGQEEKTFVLLESPVLGKEDISADKLSVIKSLMEELGGEASVERRSQGLGVIELTFPTAGR